MAKKNSSHAKRLKFLLSEIRLSGVDLARKTGTSYPLFLKVSSGERSITREYAEQIMRVTGIDPEWLLGEYGEDCKPQALNFSSHVPYTKECYLEYSARGGREDWFSPVDSASRYIALDRAQEMVWKLSWLIVACLRSNRFCILHYHFFKLAKFIIKVFKLNVNRDYLVFLECDPFAWRQIVPGAAKAKKGEKFKIITAKADKTGGYDMSGIHCIERTFNPLFLIEISEALKTDDKMSVKKKLSEAQASLEVLSEHLNV